MRIEGQINGEQLFLQVCTEERATETYVSWLNDISVNRYLESRYTEQTIETVKTYINSNLQSETEILFAMIARDTNKHIGNVHLTVNKMHKRCFIAYIIGEKDYWGRGIATEAIKLATNWAFHNLDIARMDGALYADNIGSEKAVMKAGYKREGVRRDYNLLDNGRRVDCIEVGLLREEFEQLDYSKDEL